MLRYCRGRIGRQESVIGSADDVAQEVCLAVVNALPGYQLKGLSFRAFVYGIAAHKVTDAFRAIGRNRTEPIAELPDAPVLARRARAAAAGPGAPRAAPAPAATSSPRASARCSSCASRSACRAEETAAAVGSTPGAVRVTQHRALNRLRAEIGTLEGMGLDGPSTRTQRHQLGATTMPRRTARPTPVAARSPPARGVA